MLIDGLGSREIYLVNREVYCILCLFGVSQSFKLPLYSTISLKL